MNQPLPSDDNSPSTLQPNINQHVENSSLGGGQQAAIGNRNIQIQGSENQINNINLVLFSNKAIVEKTQNSQEPNITPSELVINSSGNWILLHGHFFLVETVRWHLDRTITVQIPSLCAQDDAIIQSLRPDRWGQSPQTTFAHRNDGFFVKVEGMEAESGKDSYMWTLKLKPINIEYGGSSFEMSYQAHDRIYSVDDIAQLRGERILLNNLPKLVTNTQSYSLLAQHQMLETLIRGIKTPIQVEDCVFPPLYSVHKDKPKLFLELARLVAIFHLKASCVVEQVLELTLGPIEQARLHVKFRGRRRKVYANVEPSVIEIEGDFFLE